MAPPRRSRGDDEERHARKGKRRKHHEERSSATPWIIGGSVIAVVLIVAAVVLIIVFNKGDKEKEVAQGAPPMQPRGGIPPGFGPDGRPLEPEGKAGLPGKPAEPIKPSEPAKKDDSPIASSPAASSEQPADFAARTGSESGGNDVYPYLLKSAVFILVVVEVQTPMGRGYSMAMGSGSLVDRKNRLILTNDHVAGDAKEVVVFFPTYENGKLVAERDRFIQQFRGKKDVIKAKILATDPKIDLCLLQADRVPEGIEALPFSKAQATPGQRVHSIGTPGDSEGMFLYTFGTVRQVYHKRWRSGSRGESVTEHEADVVETQSPTNQGDSGGPLVNDRGEMVGVTHGGHAEANSLSLFIDVSEARRFVERTVESKLSMKWAPDARKPLQLASRGASGGNVTELVKNLGDGDANKRAKAAEMLGEMGEGAKLAIPSLLKTLKDKDDLTRRAAAGALSKIGLPDKSDVSLLAQALKEPTLEVRQYAANTLDKLGADAKPAAAALVEALKDEDSSVRQTAARTLGKLGPDVKASAAKELTALLDHAEKETRVAAGEGLSAMLIAADDLPALQRMLKHKDAEVRVFAVKGLARLGKDAKPLLTELLDSAKGGNLEMRKAALAILAGLTGGEAKPHLGLVGQALKDGDKETKQVALLVVAKLAADAQSIAQNVREVMREPELRKDAIAALAKIGANSKVTVPALVEGLKDPDEGIREAALKAIGDIGPPAAAATNDLINLFDKAREIPDRADASAYLDKIAAVVAKLGRPAVPSLIKALQEQNAPIRWGACKALGAMGPVAREADRALQELSALEPNLFIAQEADKARRKISAR
jgi:HEAT repeat protein